jgi:alkaline ceramidase
MCDFWISLDAPILHSIFHVLMFFSACSYIVMFAFFKAAEKAAHLKPEISYWPSSDHLPEILRLPYVHFSAIESKIA